MAQCRKKREFLAGSPSRTLGFTPTPPPMPETSTGYRGSSSKSSISRHLPKGEGVQLEKGKQVGVPLFCHSAGGEGDWLVASRAAKCTYFDMHAHMHIYTSLTEHRSVQRKRDPCAKCQ